MDMKVFVWYSLNNSSSVVYNLTTKTSICSINIVIDDVDCSYDYPNRVDNRLGDA